jgi:hypothetical protein
MAVLADVSNNARAYCKTFANFCKFFDSPPAGFFLCSWQAHETPRTRQRAGVPSLFRSRYCSLCVALAPRFRRNDTAAFEQGKPVRIGQRQLANAQQRVSRDPC